VREADKRSGGAGEEFDFFPSGQRGQDHGHLRAALAGTVNAHA
jgi:hypothetical protein